ncbi:hypothetical protein MANES_08G093611v8 [Manihot esculenta]|uniref:Uncharacterized protein n=1 Tax=Manihot esculenta TaxID=3983 RepID=A0ACB7HBY7_MANES|nr:hypothetical protein MANES_08G093611v8 [Manihot esculenta]
MFSKVPYLHEIGTQIKSIQAKIMSVFASMQNYGIKLDAEGKESRSTSEMQRQLRRSYPHDQEDEVPIGIYASQKNLLNWICLMIAVCNCYEKPFLMPFLLLFLFVSLLTKRRSSPRLPPGFSSISRHKV